ncbi:MAG: hypothetical protein FWE23_02760 [Chitinivibrionia bacterium]|nr:hypothetical protein [Chitinivibrionia bacterium]
MLEKNFSSEDLRINSIKDFDMSPKKVAERLNIINKLNNMNPIVINVEKDLTKTEAKNIVKEFGEIEHFDGRAVVFPIGRVGEIIGSNRYLMTRIIKNLPNLYKTSIKAWSESEIKFAGHKEHPNFKEYHHYVNKFTDGANGYYIRFAIPETIDGQNNVRTAVVSDMEIYAKSDLVQPALGHHRGEETKPPFIDYGLRDFFNSTNPNINNIQTNHSKSQG